MLFESLESLAGIFSSPGKYNVDGQKRSLAELAGYPTVARLLIINADDFGLCPSTNLAVQRLYENGHVNSISMFVGADGFEQAARRSQEPYGTWTASIWRAHVAGRMAPRSARSCTGSCEQAEQPKRKRGCKIPHRERASKRNASPGG